MALQPRIGEEGEALAVAYLRRKGYRIIERNYRCPLGEMDIVAVDGKTLCFVEVKTRSTEKYGGPEVAVHRQKQERLSKIALWFLKERHLEHMRARFDVVAIRRRGELNRVEHFRNAFDLAYGSMDG
ncbi:MAG: YraN family protein [Deltaproteobacteria bacterium]|nr:YraN family protein [Deltaproteobacteria bacterium]MBW2120766.1 YraN family protein [Deltaproteobacteria bacterium]